MGMGTTSNISTGKPKSTGAVFWNPDTTAQAISDATTALTAFKNLGYVSQDGITNGLNQTSSNVKAWGGDVVLNLVTEKEDKFTLTLIEHQNADVAKAVYGEGNVTVGAGGAIEAIKVNNNELSAAQWCFDIAIKGGMKRIFIPFGTITNIGDISYVDESAISYTIDISCVPDASGNTHYEYFA